MVLLYGPNNSLEFLNLVLVRGGIEFEDLFLSFVINAHRHFQEFFSESNILYWGRLLAAYGRGGSVRSYWSHYVYITQGNAVQY
jgi:hypothetical protein